MSVDPTTFKNALRCVAMVHEDEEGFVLQIEFANDHGITLTCWKNGDPPTVGLWRASNSQPFMGGEFFSPIGLESFQDWVVVAMGGQE
jgi:hypothetical protein